MSEDCHGLLLFEFVLGTLLPDYMLSNQLKQVKISQKQRLLYHLKEQRLLYHSQKQHLLYHKCTTYLARIIAMIAHMQSIFESQASHMFKHPSKYHSLYSLPVNTPKK